MAGDAQEVAAYVEEFARAQGWWIRRRDGRIAAFGGGSLLSAHPQAVRLVFHLSENGTLRAEPAGFPWVRRKARRIAQVWLAAIADYAGARMRGLPPERARTPVWFACCAADPASAAFAFGGLFLSAVAAMSGVFIVATMLGMILVQQQLDVLEARGRLLEQFGYLPLPRLDEIHEVRASFGAVLAAGMIFAVPLTAFLGGVMAAALVLSEAIRRFVSLPAWMGLYCAGFAGLALWRVTDPWVALPFALMIPLGACAGYSLVWAARREARRDRPPRARPAIVVLLLAGIAAVIAAQWTPAKEIPRRTGEARDALLLGTKAGRYLAELYYRYNLYSANMLWEALSPGDEGFQRQQPIAVLHGAPNWVPDRLTQWGIYHGESDAADRAADFVITDRTVHGAWHYEDAQSLRAALESASKKSFRGGMLRDLVGLGFATVHYTLPLWFLWALAVPVVVSAGGAYRRWKIRGAAAACAGWLAVSTAGLAAVYAPKKEALGSLREIQRWLEGNAESAAPAVEIVKSSKDPAVQWRGLYAISQWLEPAERASHPSAWNAAREARRLLAESGDVRVRVWAVGVLGRSTAPENFAALQTAVREDPELFVRYRAAGALGEYAERGGRGWSPEAAARALRERMERDIWYCGRYALAAWRRVPGATTLEPPASP